MVLDFGYTATWCLSVAGDVTLEYWECFIYFYLFIFLMECRTIWWNIHRCEWGLTFCTIYQGGKQCKFLTQTHRRAATSANRHLKKNSQRFRGGKCRRRVSCRRWWRCGALVPAGWGLSRSSLCEKRRILWRAAHETPPTGPTGPQRGLHTVPDAHTKIHNIKNRNMTHILHINSGANTTFKCLLVG